MSKLLLINSNLNIYYNYNQWMSELLLINSNLNIYNNYNQWMSKLINIYNNYNQWRSELLLINSNYNIYNQWKYWQHNSYITLVWKLLIINITWLVDCRWDDYYIFSTYALLLIMMGTVLLKKNSILNAVFTLLENKKSHQLLADLLKQHWDIIIYIYIY